MLLKGPPGVRNVGRICIKTIAASVSFKTMEGFVLVNSSVLLLWALVLVAANYEPSIYALTKHQIKKQPGSSYLWFGPRLGRQKRSANENDMFRFSDMEKQQFSSYYDGVPLTILAVTDAKHFNNRLLGREADEDFGISDARLLQEDVRSPPFAPRLGRRMLPFIPRLGRDNDKSPSI